MKGSLSSPIPGPRECARAAGGISVRFSFPSRDNDAVPGRSLCKPRLQPPIKLQTSSFCQEREARATPGKHQGLLDDSLAAPLPDLPHEAAPGTGRNAKHAARGAAAGRSWLSPPQPEPVRLLQAPPCPAACGLCRTTSRVPSWAGALLTPTCMGGRQRPSLLGQGHLSSSTGG